MLVKRKNYKYIAILIVAGLAIAAYTGVFNLAITRYPSASSQVPTSVTFNTVPGGVSIHASWCKGNGEHGVFGTQVSTEGDTGTTTFSFSLPHPSQILFTFIGSKSGYNDDAGGGFTNDGDHIIYNMTLTVKDDLKTVQSSPLTYLNKYITVEGTCSGTQISDGKGTIVYRCTESLTGKQSLTGIYKKSGTQYYLDVTFASSKSPEPSSEGNDFIATYIFKTFPPGATVNAFLIDLQVMELPEGYPDYGYWFPGTQISSNPDDWTGYPILSLFEGVTPCTWNVNIEDGQGDLNMFTSVARWTIEKEGYDIVTMPTNGTFFFGQPTWNHMILKVNEWLHLSDSLSVINLKLTPERYLNKIVTISGTCLSSKITDSTGSLPIQHSSSLSGSYTLTGTFVFSAGRYCINVQTATKR